METSQALLTTPTAPEGKPADKTRLYYPELDGLRFLAFLLVLIHHSDAVAAIPAWKMLKQFGWMGVDLFLCLSAYLFTRLLFVEYQQKGDIHIRYFYIRRALRIWPLYFIFVGAMLLYSALTLGWQNRMFARSLAMFTFTDNLLSMAWGYNGLLLYTSHLWSISYEEQFYLAIPWALRLCYRLKRERLLLLAGLILLGGMMLRAFFIYYQVKHPAIWVFPLTHFESVLGGLVLGLGLLDHFLERVPGWLWLISGLTALGLVTRLPNVDVIQWKLMLTYPLVGMGVACVLFASLQGQLGPLSRWLRHPQLGYLGKISYGLYVYHLASRPFANLITTALVPPTQLLTSAAIGLIIRLVATVLVAMLSYETLEKPFLRLKERFTFIHSRPV